MANHISLGIVIIDVWKMGCSSHDLGCMMQLLTFVHILYSALALIQCTIYL